MGKKEQEPQYDVSDIYVIPNTEGNQYQNTGYNNPQLSHNSSFSSFDSCEYEEPQLKTNLPPAKRNDTPKLPHLNSDLISLEEIYEAPVYYDPVHPPPVVHKDYPKDWRILYEEQEKALKQYEKNKYNKQSPYNPNLSIH